MPLSELGKPLISVLLPFYNEGEWLQEAIESIIRQTFKNWELILISNRAESGTLSIAERFKKSDYRILLVEEEKPGIAFALNKGLSSAKGKYIARMDADDVSLPHRLAHQLDFLEKEPAYGLVSCQTAFHPEGANGEGFGLFMNWQNSITSAEEHSLYRFIESPLAHPTAFFRKSLIQKYGPYRTEPMPEDYELWLRWLNKEVKFYKLNEILVLWRDHDKRLSRISSNYSPQNFILTKAEYIRQYLQLKARHRKIIICGAGPSSRKKSKALIDRNIEIYGYTDVKVRNIPGKLFIPAHEINTKDHYFYISFISGRGKGKEVRSFLNSMQLKEGEDFIIAG